MSGHGRAEKEFYLREFRGKSLLVAVRAIDLEARAATDSLVAVLRDLLANTTRVLLCVDIGGAEGANQPVTELCNRLAPTVWGAQVSPLVCPPDPNQGAFLGQVWAALRLSPLCVSLWPAHPTISFLQCVQQLAVRLKVYKLVLLDPAGAITADGGRLSFINGAVLQEILRPGEAEWAGLGSRRPLLHTIHAALTGGVSSVALCPLAGLEQELFTYEGSGTLFTLSEYCRVERLGIDDFDEVEQLLQRGEREGYLKARTEPEIGQLLLHGYGAKLGIGTGGLAGFCALLPYPSAQAGEVAGLYTVTRFQGEGIGGRLIATMIAEGERAGMRYLFACTGQEGAQRLFERYGFRRVPPEAVPAEKWDGYEPGRKQRIAVYRRELA
ncbi:MAG: GNAT family N-acetyltransferase [Candidatus Binatia bacterium]|nr:GNAT family N-acetyltransferase [Candidatus Binatia bacterium]